MSGPIVSLDVARLRRVDDTDAQQVEAVQAEIARHDAPAPQDAPASPPGGEQPSSPFSDKARARADLAATYAALLGADMVRQDLIETLSLGGDEIPPEAIASALSEAGLTTSTQRVDRLVPSLWPALAQMRSGQVVLVLGQDGDQLDVYDTTCVGNRAEVNEAEFREFFSGVIIRAGMGAAMLARKHAAQQDQQHWFWGRLFAMRRNFAEIALGSFVANLLAVAIAMFSLQVYDRVIPHQSTATLWVLAIGAALAMLMEAGLRIARSKLMDGAGRRMELSIQKMLMDRVLGMQRGLNGHSPSQTFSAVREFGAIREFFTASTIGTLTDLPFIVLFLGMVASIGGNVVWVLFIGGAVMVLPSFFLQKRMIALTRQTQGASIKSTKLLHEVIYEADTIKAQRGEERFRQLWNELNAVSSLATSEQRQLGSVLTYWAQGVQQATYIAAVVTGTFLVFSGNYTVGTIIAVGILTSRTLGPLTQLAGTLARWSNVKAALDALDAVVDAPQDLEEGRSYLRRESFTGAFELRELGFSYDEENTSLDIPGLIIQPGQKVAVLGVNGSGKSTFLKLLSGIYRPTRGRVLIDGVDIAQVNPKDLRRAIGYLSQEVRLFSGTLRDNLNLTLLERDDDRLMQALDFAGLGQLVRTHPRGLDMAINDGGEGLSVGQRQSIGWARLWLQDPQICLLDEPTAALDQTLEATLVSRLEGWLAQRTAIIATHRMPILQLTDRTVILQDGRLAVDGPRDQVLAHLAGKKAG